MSSASSSALSPERERRSKINDKKSNIKDQRSKINSLIHGDVSRELPAVVTRL
uniref:Uncharacterized protein n=1 Tax=Pristionchus pacificus TaxID=54126 RepID=A0A2A6C7F5_PRIPA|eukprot:PDM74142.1 hypothetical protein PRIPAC_41498 [Pristionchus pacificus]